MKEKVWEELTELNSVLGNMKRKATQVNRRQIEILSIPFKILIIKEAV